MGKLLERQKRQRKTGKTMSYKANTLYRDLSNENYHSAFGWYSSSQVKEALIDVQYFYLLYIAKEISKESTSAMDIGTYFHTAVLEPEKLNDECAIFTGKVRRGTVWEEFRTENAGKVILTQTEAAKAHVMVDAVGKDAESMALLREGEPEVSAFAKLEDLNIRVRADWIDFDKGFILDLKSTQGNPRNVMKIKKTIEMYHYDLSAALYLDAFNAVQKAKGEPLLKDFYWTFASKDMAVSQLYRATDKMIELGRFKYRRALKELKEAEANGWVFPATCIDVSPLPYIEDQWKNDSVYLEPKGKTAATGGDLL